MKLQETIRVIYQDLLDSPEDKAKQKLDGMKAPKDNQRFENLFYDYCSDACAEDFLRLVKEYKFLYPLIKEKYEHNEQSGEYNLKPIYDKIRISDKAECRKYIISICEALDLNYSEPSDINQVVMGNMDEETESHSVSIASNPSETRRSKPTEFNNEDILNGFFLINENSFIDKRSAGSKDKNYIVKNDPDFPSLTIHVNQIGNIFCNTKKHSLDTYSNRFDISMDIMTKHSAVVKFILKNNGNDYVPDHSILVCKKMVHRGPFTKCFKGYSHKKKQHLDLQLNCDYSELVYHFYKGKKMISKSYYMVDAPFSLCVSVSTIGKHGHVVIKDRSIATFTIVTPTNIEEDE